MFLTDCKTESDRKQLQNNSVHLETRNMCTKGKLQDQTDVILDRQRTIFFFVMTSFITFNLPSGRRCDPIRGGLLEDSRPPVGFTGEGIEFQQGAESRWSISDFCSFKVSVSHL